MRVLAVTNLHPSPLFPRRGVFNRRQFRALAATNELRLIVPIPWTDELRRARGHASPLPGTRQEEVDGIRIDYPRYWFSPKVLRGWYGHCFRRSIADCFDAAVEEFRPDVVLAPWAYPDGWAAVHLARKHALPAVVKLHGSDVLVLSKVRACRRRLAETLTQADGILAVSADLAHRAIELGAAPDRVRVVYDGVDTTLFFPGSRAEARARLGLNPTQAILVAVGNLVPIKGLDVLIDACRLLKQQGHAFNCYIIGEGVLRRRLEDQIRLHELGAYVQLVGPLAHDRLPDWFRAANWCVLPSHSEGVPSVLLEAQACGIPFVASRVGGIVEIADAQSDTLVPPGNPRALAEALSDRIRRGVVDRRLPYTRSDRDEAGDIHRFLSCVLATARGSRDECVDLHPSVRSFLQPRTL